MKSLFKRLLFTTAAAVVAVAGLIMGGVQADAAVPQSVAFPVSQTFTTNSSSVSGTFTYEWSSVGTAPMPAGSSSGSFVFTIDGTQTVNLPEITFNTVGVYEYQLVCRNDGVTGYTYDPQAYKIDVYVTNSTDTPTVLVYLSDGSSAGDKAPVISFAQTYQGPINPPSVTPTPTQTPTPQPNGPSAQTGGILASGTNWVLPGASAILAVGAICVLVAITRRRKAEDQEDTDTGDTVVVDRELQT